MGEWGQSSEPQKPGLESSGALGPGTPGDRRGRDHGKPGDVPGGGVLDTPESAG